MFVLFFLLGCELSSSEKTWNDTAFIVSSEDSYVTDFEAGTTLEGDLIYGNTLDLSWAELAPVACWPRNENINFEGNHIFYEMSQPSHSRFTARVIPNDDELDVNIYILQFGIGEEQTPPRVTQAVTCEAGYPWATNDNPGSMDYASVDAIQNEYSILIGVAGHRGVVSGRYTLETSIEDY